MKISNSLEISNLRCLAVVFVALDNPKATKKAASLISLSNQGRKLNFFSYVALDMLKNMKKIAFCSSQQTKDDKNPIYDFEQTGPQ